MMRALRYLLGGFALSTAYSAALVAQKTEQMQPINVGRSAAGSVSIRLVGSFAKLTVTGWDRDSVSLTGSIPYGASLTGMVGNEPLMMSAKVNMQLPEGMTKSAGTLELRVPLRAHVQVRGGNAEITAGGIAGDLDINVVGGSVRASGNPHVLTVDAMDASITLDGSPEYVRLKSAAGDIVMTGGSPDARLNSISGNIRVSGGAFDRASFETVEGTINFSGDFARGALTTFDTHSGNIEIALVPKSTIAIDAASFTGTIENTWSSVHAMPGRDGRGQELFSDAGLGSGRAAIRTFKGVVRLVRRG